MAFSQSVWFQKLTSFVPSWIFEKEGCVSNRAVYNAIAKILSEAQTSSEFLVTQTYIQLSENPWLALHGFERGLEQLPLESDVQFAHRVADLKGHSDVPSLKALVDATLIVGTSIFREHFAGGPCLSRGSFLNRYEVIIDKHYNWFTVLVPPQRHVPYSFMSAGNFPNFLGRGNFMGSDTTLPTGKLMSVIDQILKKNKAFGVAYRLFEATH